MRLTLEYTEDDKQEAYWALNGFKFASFIMELSQRPQMSGAHILVMLLQQVLLLYKTELFLMVQEQIKMEQLYHHNQ